MTLSAGRIVVGIGDGAAEEVSGALRWAEQRSRETGRPIVVVHAWTPATFPIETMGMIPPGDMIAWQDLSVQRETASTVTASVVARLHAAGLVATATTVCDSAADAILSGLTLTDEVVVGIRETGALRHSFGSQVVHVVLHRAPCPVIVVPDAWVADPTQPQRVVVGYDWTPLAQAALTWAIGECARSGAQLVAVRSVLPLGDPSSQADAGHRLAAHVRSVALDGGVTDVAVRQVTVSLGAMGEQLDELARGARALVLGNHRASWLAAAVGASTTEGAVLCATVPVVVVPGSSDPPPGRPL
jgi:nucleotide-binding universal stress UspA family protein